MRKEINREGGTDFLHHYLKQLADYLNPTPLFSAMELKMTKQTCFYPL